MGVTWVQGNSLANGGSPTAVLAYINPNAAGNMGVAWCFTGAQGLPASLSDTNGNAWCQVNSNINSQRSVSVFVCMSLAPGANTVTGVFTDLAIGGFPCLHIYEYAVSGPAAIVAMQPTSGTFSPNAVVGEMYYASIAANVAQPITVAIFLGIIDASQHSWIASAPSVQRESSLLSTDKTTVTGDAISAGGPYQSLFDCEFDNGSTLTPYVTNLLAFAVVTA